MSGKHQLISDQLRDAIGASGETRYRISKETSIAQSALSRFMSGERGLTSSAIDTLCEYLNLELMKRKRRKRT